MPQSWDRFFYFPSGGRHAEDFHVRKNPTASAGFEPVMCMCTVRLSGKAYSFLKIRLGETFAFAFRAVKVLNLKIQGSLQQILLRK